MAMHAGRQRNELLALDAARVLFGAVAHVVGLREVWEDVRPLFKRAAHWLSRRRLAPAAGQLLGSPPGPRGPNSRSRSTIFRRKGRYLRLSRLLT
jgi:hypothetical protein